MYHIFRLFPVPRNNFFLGKWQPLCQYQRQFVNSYELIQWALFRGVLENLAPNMPDDIILAASVWFSRPRPVGIAEHVAGHILLNIAVHFDHVGAPKVQNSELSFKIGR
jgi:hypothetical protein